MFDLDTSNAAFTEGHHFPEPFVNFDFDAVDGHPEPPPDDSALAAEAVGRLLDWCWHADSRRRSHEAPGIAFRRFAILTQAIRPALVGCRNYAELSSKLGITKAAVSKSLISLRETFGVHVCERSDTSREHMRQARLRQRDASGRTVGRNFRKPAAS